MLILAVLYDALSALLFAVYSHQLSAGQSVLYLADLLIGEYHIWNAFRLATFGVHIIFCWLSLTGAHISEELNGRLATFLRKYYTKGHDGRFLLQLLLLPLLSRFYVEYRWLMATFDRFNRRLVSQLAYTGIAANVVFNLVLVGSLLFRREAAEQLPARETVFLVLIIVAQALVTLGCTTGLTASSKVQIKGAFYFLSTYKGVSVASRHKPPFHFSVYFVYQVVKH